MSNEIQNDPFIDIKKINNILIPKIIKRIRKLKISDNNKNEIIKDFLNLANYLNGALLQSGAVVFLDQLYIKPEEEYLFYYLTDYLKSLFYYRFRAFYELDLDETCDKTDNKKCKCKKCNLSVDEAFDKVMKKFGKDLLKIINATGEPIYPPEDPVDPPEEPKDPENPPQNPPKLNVNNLTNTQKTLQNIIFHLKANSHKIFN